MVVASAIGCDPSYISQLMEEDEFKTTVLVSRAKKAEGQVSRDKKWDSIEDAALAKAERMLPFVQKPGDLIRIASMANAAKRRATEFAGVSDDAAPTVVLNLPANSTVHFQMNAQSQVIAVEGRSMQALSTSKLAKMVTPVSAEDATITDMSISQPQQRERQKVASILEQIGYADEAVEVPALMERA